MCIVHVQLTTNAYLSPSTNANARHLLPISVGVHVTFNGGMNWHWHVLTLGLLSDTPLSIAILLFRTAHKTNLDEEDIIHPIRVRRSRSCYFLPTIPTATPILDPSSSLFIVELLSSQTRYKKVSSPVVFLFLTRSFSLQSFVCHILPTHLNSFHS